MELLSLLAFCIVTAKIATADRLKTQLENNLEPRPAGDCSRFMYEYNILEKLIKLESENAKQQERIVVLEKEHKQSPVVSVHVGLSKTTALSGNQRVKYDVEISNIGGAYDLNNGQFTAPVSGIYLIHVQLCLKSGGDWMDLNILKDGALIGRVFAGDDAYHSCGTELLNIHLKQEEQVWVVRETGQATSLNQDHGWNSFKAVLLQED